VNQRINKGFYFKKRMNNKNKTELSSSLKLLVKSSVIVLVGVVLSKIFSYAYRIIIAREFGPETYGLFSLAMMVVGWFTIISLLGINNGIVRFVAYYRGKRREREGRYLVRKFVLIVGLISLILGGALFFLSEFIAGALPLFEIL
jgi:O-antigen/teichoic acid export membrane protein